MRRLVCLPLLLTCCAAPNTERACRIVPVAETKLSIRGNLPIVDVTIQGQPARLELDTGASAVLITEDAARRLGLSYQIGVFHTATSVDAQAQARLTTPTQITLGGHPLKPLPMLTVPSITAVAAGSGVDGMLGASALSAYDVEVDLARRRLGLYEPRNCPDGPSPLQGASVTYRSPPNLYGYLSVPVRVDGRALSLLADTGANATALSQDRLELSAADLAGDREVLATTSGPGKASTRVHRFHRVEVADMVITDGTFITGKIPLQFDGLLGTDFWRNHRVWLSYAGSAISIQLHPPK